jgi:glycosyltransferase involved in cell wall biosynthesis
LGLSLAFISRILGKNAVVTIHNLGEMVDLSMMKIKASILDKIGIILITKIITLASQVVVTIPSYVTYLSSRFKAKNVQYISHGVWRHLPTKAISLASERYNCSNSNNVILMFGNMAPSKGLTTLFEAFQMLVKERSDIELWIGGSDHPRYLGFLDHFIEQRFPHVRFLGYVEENAIPELFRKVSVIVLPYLTMTGSSGVFHLACGYGKPIIASNLPEIRELLDEGASAILFTKGRADILRDKLLCVFQNPDVIKEMVTKNFVYAKKVSLSNVVHQYMQIYSKSSDNY